MRSNQSHSKLLQSGGKQNRAQNQKELRQAQRQQPQTHQQQQFMMIQTDSDMTYSTMQQQQYQQMPRTVKNTTAAQRHHQASYSTASVSEMMSPNGTPIGQSSQLMPKSNLTAARQKLASGTSSNLFGGLSRHVLNASSNQQQQQMQINSRGMITPANQSQNSASHARGPGSTGYLYQKGAGNQQQQMMTTPRQTSQHNVNYLHPLRSSPSGMQQQYSGQQQCGRTLAALENMNQSQMKMRKSESVQQSSSSHHLTQHLLRGQQLDNYLANSVQQHQLIPQQQPSQSQIDEILPPKLANYQNSVVSSQDRQQTTSKGKHKIQKIQRNSQQAQPTSNGATNNGTRFIKQKSSLNQKQREMEESQERMRSYSDLQEFQPQPQPVPHKQFLSPQSSSKQGFSNRVSASNFNELALQQEEQEKQQQLQMSACQAFSKRSSLLNQQVQNEQKVMQSLGRGNHMASPNSLSRNAVDRQDLPQKMLKNNNTNQQSDDSPACASVTEQTSSQEQIISIRTNQHQEQASFKSNNNNTQQEQQEQQQYAMDDGLSQDNMMGMFPERDSTPERITPITKKEPPMLEKNNNILNGVGATPTQQKINIIQANNASALIQHRPTHDVSVGAHLCCHEQGKQHAVMVQKISFMTEQIKEDKKQASMKEAQYNKIIDALKKTAEENNQRQRAHQQNSNGQDVRIPQGSQDWHDTLDELNKKKEQVNDLEEKVLSLELKAEKVALEHKNRIQDKDDEISEAILKFKHKESDYRQAMSQVERLNEDIQSRIQEALDRQSDRLASEKQADMDAMNRRNEQLIKQLVESHSTETRQLRDMLLQQERKCREAEQNAGNLEIELRTVKLENNNRFDPSEMEEIQMQNAQVNEMRLQGIKAQFTDENQQLRDVIEQLETHINQLQESRSESDRKLIVAEDKVSELKKEIAQKKILIASQKEKEEKTQMTHKAQILKERKTADIAVTKLKGVQKLEQELNKKQILINQLKAKICEMEAEEKHKSKILLMKRRQIEDEKTVLIKKQALRQRSMTRQNLSATRLQQQLDNKQAVILTERESKKALQDEKVKLEKEIQSIKKEVKGLDSSRHNESMSMYFARSQSKQKHVNESQMIFSPRNRIQNNATKSFIANAKRSMTKSSQVMMSQQQMDRNQLYLSKQFSGERTSSLGRRSLQGCDSMVNIVEFEEDRSNRSRRHNVANNSMLSTPFNLDEPNTDSKSASNLQFKTHNKFMQSQSVLANHKKPNLHQQHHNAKAKARDSTDAVNKTQGFSASQMAQPPVTGAGVAQYQTYTVGQHNTSSGMLHFEQSNIKPDKWKKMEGKKLMPNNAEAEFIQVLSGCDSSNEDQTPLGLRKQKKNWNNNQEKAFGTQLSRKNVSNTVSSMNNKMARKNSTNQQENAKHMTQMKSSTVTTKQPSLSKTGASKNNALNSSPNKIMNMSMAANLVLDEQRMIDQKESFARTVFTARQQCEEFKNTIRQKEEHAVIGRNFDSKKASQKHASEPNTANAFGASVNNFGMANQQKAYSSIEEDKIKPSADEETQSQSAEQLQKSPFYGSKKLGPRKSSPVSKDPLNDSDDAQEMAVEQQVASLNDNQMMSEEVAVGKPKENLVAVDDQHEGNNSPQQDDNQDASLKKIVSDSTLHKLVNMTSSIGENSNQEEQSQHSQRLVEENQLLREQLELVKLSLNAQQEKAATTEMTMMDAIMQMKDQIQQVMHFKTSKTMTKSGKEDKNQSRADSLNQNSGAFIGNNSEQHEDYLVMSRISNKTFLEDQMQQHQQQTNQGKGKKARQQKNPMQQRDSVPMGENTTNEQQQFMRKTNSVDLRQRSETFDVTQAQAESMYKKIKIKSPNKRANQGSVGMNANGATQGNNSGNNTSQLQKQLSNTKPRQSQQHQQQSLQVSKQNSNVNSFIQQQQMIQTSQSFYPTSQNQQMMGSMGMQDRLSVGVLKQSAKQNVQKRFIAQKSGSQLDMSHSQRYKQ